ncbi:MAG TPA: amidohydrolase family protein [Bryobacteraceae bacterium]|nr:amidohydrolase family protein [Bryobacteraceae bacterium]
MKKLLVFSFLWCCAYALAEGPSTIAITNAKIVTVSGQVYSKGTVVLKDGLIAAVGDNVVVPPDAWVVAGEGMTVYPGLIDAMSTVGIPGAAAAAGGGRGGRGGGGQAQTAAPAAQAVPAERAWGPEDRPQTTSWLLAADELQAGDKRVETVRSSGITTAVTYPTRGIFAGQGSVIDLVTGEKPADMVLVPSVGQYISMSGGRGFGGGFPSSLMGIISYVRQLYLDANHYKLVKDAYSQNPRGMQRPQYDRALEGLMASPRFLLPANQTVEIDRMLRFGAELKTISPVPQGMILYGAREAYAPEAVELLKKANVPVLLSLRWPAPPARSADGDESNETLRTLIERDKAPSAPAALAKVGVRFALYSDGTDAPRDFQRAVKKAIDAGLSREDALRALTVWPAEIYGISDRVGSIEKGKIANLVVTKGEIFDDRTQIVMVFVDGRKYTPEPPAMGGRGGPATEEPGAGGNQ